MAADDNRRAHGDSTTETVITTEPGGGDPAGRFTPGTILAGRYRIVAPLGKGGMGEVYRAEDTRLGQPVALKFLPRQLASDTESLERMRIEVSLGRQIAHPNVCRLYDIVEADHHHFVVMEYVDGEDLASLLRRIGRLPPDKALEIARGLCAGLASAHEKGVIHRDLKPGNVMVDGRGRARIADFGLAARADGGAVHGLAGTINYMAPELLNGAGASVSSDIFALGLVLYEMSTGRRVFEAKSLDELKTLHAQWRPPGLAGSGADIDRSVEKVMLHCLARDPAARPVSALAVMAALPGGDPLQAAIAQGETPSPEMVAAASEVGDLSPPVAWACLIAGLIGLWLITVVDGRQLLFRQVPLPRPPEALADRARDMLSRLGYPEGADRAYGFMIDSAFLDFVAARAPTNRFETLRNARPGPFRFYYRESPMPLVTASWIPAAPWEGAPAIGVVSQNVPPMIESGMTRVTLDRFGRLAGFLAVPAPFDPRAPTQPSFDWSPVLSEAGFDPARLEPADSLWTVPVASDLRKAWRGTLEGQPDVPFHIEAAAYRDQLVSFTMRGPWVQPQSPEPAPTSGTLVAGMVTFQLAIVVLGAAWAHRNLRLGRGDRKGAQRLAAFMFVGVTIGNLFLAIHSTAAVTEISLLMMITGQGLVGAALVWCQYLALEPSVRRRWPRALISWNRLLLGRLRDPLLGRDVLVGMLAGMAVVLTVQIDVAGLYLGEANEINRTLVVPLAPRQLLYAFCMILPLSVLYSIGFLFMLNLFHALIGRLWIAGLLLFVMFPLAAIAQTPDLWQAILSGAVLGVIVLTVLIRFGLLASAALVFTFGVLSNAPVVIDSSVWYAGRSYVVLGVFVALLALAFVTALGGKPLLGRLAIDD